MVSAEIIDHLEHPTALWVRSLLEREGPLAKQEIIIDDEENILQALEAALEFKILITTDKAELSAEVLKKLPKTVLVQEISKRTAKKLFGGEKMARIFAIAAMPTPLSLEAVSHLKGDIIVLEGLSISGNMGAIVRTARALGAAAIFLVASTIDPFDRRVIRASRGHVFKLPVLKIEIPTLIEFCKHHHFKILATSASATTTIDEIAKDPQRLAIILGSEKEGCSTILLKAADLTIKIPMNPDVESLNVSVAAGIILYLRSQGDGKM